MEEFDIIIIGAGSAGSVLADRLTADGRHRVLVLEAGGTDRRLWVKLPIGYGKTFHSNSVNWRYMTDPSQGLNGRKTYWPRGKVLGGSSSINGLVWMRGRPEDFDDWARAGNPGWAWQDVEPVFDRIEDFSPGRAARDGRISIARRSEEYHPIRQAFLDAARFTGLPAAGADRGHWDIGVGPYSITTRHGLRSSAASAFLRPAMRRNNLEVRTGVLVDRVAFDGKRAKSVRFIRRGKVAEAHARHMIILAAGAIGSPSILQRSGIGPKGLLSDLGIAPVLVNPAVGGGLQDHIGIDYMFRATQPTLNQILGTWSGQIQSALQFAWSRRGALSLSINQMGGLVRSAENLNRADLQLYFSPLSYTQIQRNRRILLRPDPWPGFSFGFNACRPTSEGRVDIQTRDPATPPLIAPNYMSTPEDEATVVAGGQLIERMLATPPMQALIADENGFNPTGATDDGILADFRDRATTVFHPTGTCRMAPKEAKGVVDPTLKVHGLDGLYVVDASVFPNITSANTNAPTIMLAARAADLLQSR